MKRDGSFRRIVQMLSDFLTTVSLEFQNALFDMIFSAGFLLLAVKPWQLSDADRQAMQKYFVDPVWFGYSCLLGFAFFVIIFRLACKAGSGEQPVLAALRELGCLLLCSPLFRWGYNISQMKLLERVFPSEYSAIFDAGSPVFIWLIMLLFLKALSFVLRKTIDKLTQTQL